MSGYRLPSGGEIDRAKPITFQWCGRSLTGFAGDTLASALLANGESVIARSIKFHRPRGIVASGHDEPNAYVQLISPFEAPGILATTLPLTEGLSATYPNAWPSLAFDLGAIADRLHPLLGAGFYYKTFMGPRWSWYERWIRRAAGISRKPTKVASIASERRFAHCDVLVIGAGLAGRDAAAIAAARGDRVMLLDRGQHAAIADVQTLPYTTALGYYDHDLVVAIERPSLHFERIWKIRAKRIIVATGAAERPFVFPGNDTPGVMLLSAAETFASRFGVAVGKRCVVVANHADAYERARSLIAAGVTVSAILDLGTEVVGTEVKLAQDANISVLLGETIRAVHGRHRVSGITVAPTEQLDARRSIECDTILMAGGWMPRLSLYVQAGGRTRFDELDRCHIPEPHDDRVTAVGAAAGVSATAGATVVELAGSRGQRAFVDFQNDVTADDLRGAVSEGYMSIELAKRYTTSGMGIDQGKLANANAAAILADATDLPPQAVHHTTFRPPYLPVPFGAIAGTQQGELLRPIRETPMTAWHIAAGAIMYEAGAGWRRPGYYPRGGESMNAAVFRECRAARETVAIYDSSPLGRFEVRGDGAAALLDRIYAGRIADLAVGRGRYALMLRDDGRLFDDGVVFRLGSDHFWVTTTTGNTDAAFAWLEHCRQNLFRSRAFIVPVQSQWANAVICGPRSRDLLASIGTDIDLDRDAFPFMAMRAGHVGGLAARVFRVSFTGELSYEINVAASHGAALWAQLMEAGNIFDITPLGSEANHVLRIEKGYISIGHEGDGTATPFDLTLDRFVAMEKPDFIGKRALEDDLFDRPRPRRELVGLLPTDPKVVLPEGAQVLAASTDSEAIGFVTASVMSPTLRRSIALALVDAGRDRQETSVHVTLGAGRKNDRRHQRAEALVTPALFFDPTGARLRG